MEKNLAALDTGAGGAACYNRETSSLDRFQTQPRWEMSGKGVSNQIAKQNAVPVALAGCPLLLSASGFAWGAGTEQGVCRGPLRAFRREALSPIGKCASAPARGADGCYLARGR